MQTNASLAQPTNQSNGAPPSVVEAYREYAERRFPIMAARLPMEEREAFLRHARRYFHPWPDWVLKMVAEILHVYAPNIPKQKIKEGVFRFHAFFFGLLPRPVPPHKTSIFPPIDERDAGALFGHMFAIFERGMREAREAFAEKAISMDEYREVCDQLSTDTFQKEMQPRMEKFFRACPTAQVSFSEAMTKAKASTFDKKGCPRETTLSPIYEKMIKNWPRIEELSGPTELCKYLDSLLAGGQNDPEAKLDRVKKICKRHKVVFKGFAGGQGHPPGLSLPEKT